MTLRHTVKQIVPEKLLRYFRRPWVVAEDQPSRPNPIDTIILYAIVGTWMEEDIIEATVLNAFAQGVDRVFLIDNNSPDDTVNKAKMAGAEHVLTYSTSNYDEERRIHLMNEFVRQTSASSPADHIWWLWLDADEFPRPQAGGTLRAMLESLDRRFRVVGARFLNHYPSPNHAAYMPGYHPIDCQPLCEELTSSMCWQGHRKHSLLRWDRNGREIASSRGFHKGICEERPLLEPRAPFIIHHFPFRDETVTRRRMHELWTRKEAGFSRAHSNDIAVTHMKVRLESIDAVYSGEWNKVSTLHFEEIKRGVSLRDWRDCDPPISPDIRRWYHLV